MTKTYSLKKLLPLIIWLSLACGSESGLALTLDEALKPVGVMAAALSPDGKHIAEVAYLPFHTCVIITDVDTNNSALIKMGKWERIGNFNVSREPTDIIWITNDLLAVDYGIYSESIAINGKKVADLGDVILGKADRNNPESPMVLVYNNFKDNEYALVNAKTGKKTVLSLPNSDTPIHPAFDIHGQLRAITMMNSSFWNDSAKITNWYKPAADKPWEKLEEFKVTDNYWIPMFVPDKENSLTVLSNYGRDTSAIFNYDTAKHQVGELMAGHETEDILRVDGIDLDTFKSVVTNGMKPVRIWFDPVWKGLQQSIDLSLPDRINVLSGDAKDRVLVFSYSDIDPGRWFILDVSTMRMHLVGEAKPQIDPDKMKPMDIVTYPSKDGLMIPAYLTKPSATKTMQPAIILIHGGPTVRDMWQWNSEVQLLASRGYVVLQPQFRGSYGFGLKFQEAGYQQWGKSMQDDITAGVDYLVREGIADPKRICIYGASYGGYAALWGLVKTPDLYRCGISFAGVSDIAKLIDRESGIMGNKITREFLRVRVGDAKLSAEQLDQVSPVKHADQIKAPLLIMHGDDDDRVPIAHSKNMMEALDDNHKVYQWIKFDDEGHGLKYVKDQYRYYNAIFAFLGKYNPPDKEEPVQNTDQSKTPTEELVQDQKLPKTD